MMARQPPALLHLIPQRETSALSISQPQRQSQILAQLIRLSLVPARFIYLRPTHSYLIISPSIRITLCSPFQVTSPAPAYMLWTWEYQTGRTPSWAAAICGHGLRLSVSHGWLPYRHSAGCSGNWRDFAFSCD